MTMINRKIKGSDGANEWWNPSTISIRKESFHADIPYVHSTTSNIQFSLMGKNILSSNVEYAKDNFIATMKKRKENILKSPYWNMDKSGKWVQANASQLSGGEDAFLDWLHTQLSPDIIINERLSVKPLESYKMLKDQMINLMKWMRQYSETQEKDKIITKEVVNKFFRETNTNGKKKVIISNVKYTNDETNVKYSKDIVKRIDAIAEIISKLVPSLRDLLVVVKKWANLKITSPNQYNKTFGSYDENITYLNNWVLKQQNIDILQSLYKKDWYKIINIDGKPFVELDVEKLALMYSMVNLSHPSDIIKDFIKNNPKFDENYLIAQMGNFAEIFIQYFSPLNTNKIKFDDDTKRGTLGGSLQAIGNVRTGLDNSYAKTDLILSLRRQYYNQTDKQSYTIGTGRKVTEKELKDTTGAATKATQANNRILASIQLKTTKDSALIGTGNLGNAVKIGDAIGVFSATKAYGLLLWMVNLSSVYKSNEYGIRAVNAKHGFTTKKISDFISQVIYCYSVVGLLNHFNFGKSLAEAPDIVYYVGHRPYFYFDELKSRFNQLKESSGQNNYRIGNSLHQILSIYDRGKKESLELLHDKQSFSKKLNENNQANGSQSAFKEAYTTARPEWVSDINLRLQKMKQISLIKSVLTMDKLSTTSSLKK